MRRAFRTCTALALAGLVGGCDFPGAFRCGPGAPCGAGARCDEATARCVAAPGSADADREAGRPADLGPPPPDAGATDAQCAAPCVRTGRCLPEFEVVDPSFELASADWSFSATAAPVSEAADGKGPADGVWMAELRLDFARNRQGAFSTLDQALPLAELPPGRHRLCVQRRIVTSLDSCPTTKAPEFTAVLLAPDPNPGGSDARSAIFWTQTEAEYCPDLTEDKSMRVSPWQELCGEVELTEAWRAPSLRFITRIGSFLTEGYFHTILIDSVRLLAPECLDLP